MIQGAAVVETTQPVDLHAAVLQGVITLCVALGGLYSYRNYRKAYLGWFSITLWLYTARIGIIAAFLATQSPNWLYWHQVATGWTALALLWTAMTFARQPPFRARYLAALVFPAAWSWVAVYELDSFLAAALPAVVFLSAVTAGTAWIFSRYARRAHSRAAWFLALTLAFWALHHLDYPFLRARGVWSPWGYYLDILFVLTTTAGLAALVLEDLQRGVNALVALAPSTRPNVDAGFDDELGTLLTETLKLPAALGSAVARLEDGAVVVVRAAGTLARWEGCTLPEGVAGDIAMTIQQSLPRITHDWPGGDASVGSYPFGAVLPFAVEAATPAALLLVGDARHPFAALDERFLEALGSQIGGAMQTRALVERLQSRTDELARLSARTIGQQEEDRRRLSLELHDETAQVLAAVKLRLGLLRERADAEMSEQLGQLADLVDTGMRGIRSVTASLRPAVLDEFGVGAALRSLAADFSQRTAIETAVRGADGELRLSGDAELAVYRSVQEALANVARHTAATRVEVSVERDDARLRVCIRDDGRGFPTDLDSNRLVFSGHAGLVGMRERVQALGGVVSFGRSPHGGAEVSLELPIHV